MLLSPEMLIMLILNPNGDFGERAPWDLKLLTLLTFLSPVGSKKRLLAGEMLIMLIVLNPFLDFPKNPNYELTVITLLAFSRRIFSRIRM